MSSFAEESANTKLFNVMAFIPICKNTCVRGFYTYAKDRNRARKHAVTFLEREYNPNFHINQTIEQLEIYLGKCGVDYVDPGCMLRTDLIVLEDYDKVKL
jgi:hypothetical protein